MTSVETLSIPLIAALPIPLCDYEADFSLEGRQALHAYAAAAQQCFVVPPTEQPSETVDRDFSYRQASIYVATHCHMLLALWDGDESKKDGCGTAAYDSHGLFPFDGYDATVDGLFRSEPRIDDADG